MVATVESYAQIIEDDAGHVVRSFTIWSIEGALAHHFRLQHVASFARLRAEDSAAQRDLDLHEQVVDVEEGW